MLKAETSLIHNQIFRKQKKYHYFCKNRCVMKNIITILSFLSLGFIGEIHAQHVNWREYVEQLAEEEGMNEAVFENMYQELLQLENNPFDLNRITRESSLNLNFYALRERPPDEVFPWDFISGTVSKEKLRNKLEMS